MGEDGATHHGVFDIAYLRCIPNLIIFAPRNEVELRNIMYTAQLGLNFPIAIRYPRGRGVTLDWKQPFTKIEIGKGVLLKEGSEIAVISIGNMAKNVTKAIESTETDKIAHYDLRFIAPLDKEMLHQIFTKYKTIITVEDGVLKGGMGSAIAEFTIINNYTKKIKFLGVPEQFIEQGTVEELQQIAGIDPESIAYQINKFL